MASTLLALCVLPVVGFSQRNVTESAVLKDDLIARQVLMDLCERYRESEPDELVRVAADPARIDRDYLLQPLGRVSAPPGMQRSLAIARDMDGVRGLHGVTFTVEWTSRDGKRRRLTLDRLIHAH